MELATRKNFNRCEKGHKKSAYQNGELFRGTWLVTLHLRRTSTLDLRRTPGASIQRLQVDIANDIDVLDLIQRQAKVEIG